MVSVASRAPSHYLWAWLARLVSGKVSVNPHTAAVPSLSVLFKCLETRYLQLLFWALSQGRYKPSPSFNLHDTHCLLLCHSVMTENTSGTDDSQSQRCNSQVSLFGCGSDPPSSMELFPDTHSQPQSQAVDKFLQRSTTQPRSKVISQLKLQPEVRTLPVVSKYYLYHNPCTSMRDYVCKTVLCERNIYQASLIIINWVVNSDDYN